MDRTLTTTDITSLPSFGRDPYELLKTAPGVFGDSSRSSNGQALSLVNNSGPGGSASSIFQTENQVQISGNGQRVSSNNFEVDGVSVNSLQWGGAAVLTPNIESVKEVNVTTSSYSAEDGRNSGVQVKVVSQTGTNAWHGSGLFKYDEPGLNAFNRYGGFNNAKPVRVENKYRQFAGSVGGPIIKDKLFFFGSYEGLRQGNTDTGNQWVATSQFIQALTSARQGTAIGKYFATAGLTPRIKNTLTQSCAAFSGWKGPGGTPGCQVVNGGIDIGSIAGTYNNYVPMFGGVSTGGGLDGVPDLQYVQVALPNTSRGNQYNGRIDYNLTNVDQIAISTYMTYFDQTGADSGAAGMSAADLNKKPVNSLVTLLWNRTFSPTLLNEARLNFSRFAFNQVDSNSNVNFGLPRIEVEGMPIGGRLKFGADRAESTPGIFAQNQYEFRDVMSKVEGARIWKFGFEMRREQDNNNLLGGARPVYSFFGLWNLANGTPIYEGINADPRTGQPADAQRHFRTNNYAIFAQNDWRVTRKLTVNLGLRWEYYSPLNDEGGQNVNLTLGQADRRLLDAKIKVGGELTNKDLNNFAPRLGFAWNPTTKLVVRGGAGVAYNRLSDALYTNTHGNPPYFARYNQCCGTAATEWGSPFAGNTIQFALGSSNSPSSYPTNTALAAGFNPTTGLPVNGMVEIWGAPENTRTPYTYLYSLDTEYALPSNMVATVGYQGSMSRKLIRIVNQNFMVPTNTSNPKFFAVFFPTGDITSNFNSLNLGIRRNFTNGLKFDAKYRWSKSLDELSNEGPGAQTNQTYPTDLSTEYGPSDFDATHYFVANAIYRLPFFKNKTDLKGMLLGGWEVSSIFTFHSGFPWTPKTNTQSYSFGSNGTLSPVRPIAYAGGAGTSADTDTFMQPNGNFPGGGKAYFDISKFGVPGIGRNSFRGPRYSSVDMTLGKNVPLQKLGLPERAALDLRMNVFNVFNKLNLNPLGFYSTGTIVEDPHFGMSDGAQSGRVVELQARFSF